MAQPDPKILALIGDLDKKDARLVSAIDEVIEILLEQKLAYKMRIPPKKVAWDKCNRGGYGVSSVEVHALGSDIVDMGFSFLATGCPTGTSGSGGWQASATTGSAAS